MGTEVASPHNCFVERIRDSPCRRRNHFHYNYNSNPNFTNPNANNRPNRKQSKRKPTISKRSISADDVSRISKNHHYHHHRKASASSVSATTNHYLVMEKVTILRRGESLDSKIKSMEKEKKEAVTDLVVTGTDRLGPDYPDMVPRQIRIVDLRSQVVRKADVCAGSAYVVSPSPSFLPLPSFSKKKKNVFVDDSATRDLRRLLRLEF